MVINMQNKIINIGKIIFSIFILSLLFSCDRDRNNPGYQYIPDMVYSQAYEADSENPVFNDSMTNLVPVAGSMPRDMVAFRFDVTPENRLFAGQNLLAEAEINMKFVFEGKKLFTTFCKNCHGTLGKGTGFLNKSGKLPVQPADLTQERLVKASRGEIFHVLTTGYGLMGAHGAQIAEIDRWRIVEYVKVKIQKQKMGERTLAAANPALNEPYADFEARIAKTFPRTAGIGPVTSMQLEAINAAMAAEGQELFKIKCSSCHKPTRKYVGPAPKGILDRRNPEWIMNMILNPEEMVANDPIAKELLKRYLSPMANQNLTEDEARKVLEYFRTLN